MQYIGIKVIQNYVREVLHHDKEKFKSLLIYSTRSYRGIINYHKEEAIFQKQAATIFSRKLVPLILSLISLNFLSLHLKFSLNVLFVLIDCIDGLYCLLLLLGDILDVNPVLSR